jgi:hypothetical protein
VPPPAAVSVVVDADANDRHGSARNSQGDTQGAVGQGRGDPCVHYFE